MAKKGKLIVIEGSDGTGKTTQAKLLLSYLRKNKIPCAYISFPRYEKSLWAKMVRMYLNGDFGKINEVDPRLGSMLYAGDRLSATPQIRKWLDEGKIVICNRYVGSNMAHMGAKFKNQSDKSDYIKWLGNLEYKENSIPKEDLVILLHVPVEVSKKLMKDRKLDIHESNLDYLGKVVETYRGIAKTKKNWVVVDCTVSGQILLPGQIGKKLIQALEAKSLL